MGALSVRKPYATAREALEMALPERLSDSQSVVLDAVGSSSKLAEVGDRLLHEKGGLAGNGRR
jgi:hypothetical protein